MPSVRNTKAEAARRLGVSRSSLYYVPKPRSDEALLKEIRDTMDAHPAYGHRRVASALRRNRKAVRRVMLANKLRPRVCRRFRRPAKPDDLGREEAEMPNVLAVLRPIRADVVWAGDFTYVWLLGRFWYVATVIDVFTREVVGGHVGAHHTAALVAGAFLDAVRRRGRAPRWFHSDQGSEYDAASYAGLLALHDTAQSMSRKGCPWQNGFQESFYANFKLELGDVSRFARVEEMIEAVYGQLAYYNGSRIHSALGMPPAEFRKSQEQKNAAFAAPTNLTIYPPAVLVKSV
jgi:transposase InsO family protein